MDMDGFSINNHISAIGFGFIAGGYNIGAITINRSLIYVTTVCNTGQGSITEGVYGACIGFGSLLILAHLRNWDW